MAERLGVQVRRARVAPIICNHGRRVTVASAVEFPVRVPQPLPRPAPLS